MCNKEIFHHNTCRDRGRSERLSFSYNKRKGMEQKKCFSFCFRTIKIPTMRHNKILKRKVDTKQHIR